MGRDTKNPFSTRPTERASKQLRLSRDILDPIDRSAGDESARSRQVPLSMGGSPRPIPVQRCFCTASMDIQDRQHTPVHSLACEPLAHQQTQKVSKQLPSYGGGGGACKSACMRAKVTGMLLGWVDPKNDGWDGLFCPSGVRAYFLLPFGQDEPGHGWSASVRCGRRYPKTGTSVQKPATQAISEALRQARFRLTGHCPPVLAATWMHAQPRCDLGRPLSMDWTERSTGVLCTRFLFFFHIGLAYNGRDHHHVRIHRVNLAPPAVVRRCPDSGITPFHLFTYHGKGLRCYVL